MRIILSLVALLLFWPLSAQAAAVWQSLFNGVTGTGTSVVLTGTLPSANPGLTACVGFDSPTATVTTAAWSLGGGTPTVVASIRSGNSYAALVAAVGLAPGAGTLTINFSENIAFHAAATTYTGVASLGATATSTTPGTSITLTPTGLVTGDATAGCGALLHSVAGALGVSPNARYTGNLPPIGIELGDATDTTGVTFGWSNASAGAAMTAVRLVASPPDTTPPTDPTGLVANAISSSSIALAWNASTDNVSVVNYRVERCQGLGCVNFVEVAQPTTTSYTSTGLAANTLYRHRVRAFDGTNLSGYSNISDATTLALRTATLTWTDNSPNAQNPVAEDGFTCQRCAGSGCSSFLDFGSVGPNVTTLIDAASPAPVAGYRCRATLAGSGDSEYSNIVYTSTLPPAVLSVSPPSLTFAATIGAGNPPSQSLTISNAPNTQPMNWTVTDDAAWVTVTPATGTDTTVVTVAVNTAGLSSGTQFATITIQAPGATGSPQTVLVTLNLSPAASPAVGKSGRIR